MRVYANGIHVNVTIDEGSEINYICASIAVQMKLKFVPVNLQAKAAGSQSMILLCKLQSPLHLALSDTNRNATIVLMDVIVVKNLGPSILIGEPGKMDNQIVTLSAQKLIQLKDANSDDFKIPYNSNSGPPKRDFHPLVDKAEHTLYPGDIVAFPVHESMRSSVLQISARRGLNMDLSEIKKVKDKITIENNTDELIKLPKIITHN